MMEEGELLEWIERESVGWLGRDVRNVAMDELGLVKYGVEDERVVWEDKLGDVDLTLEVVLGWCEWPVNCDLDTKLTQKPRDTEEGNVRKLGSVCLFHDQEQG